MKTEDIILVGGGGHCKSVIDVIEQQNLYRIVGIVDMKENLGKEILGYPVIAEDNDLVHLTQQYTHFHITLGFLKNPNRRIEIYQQLIAANANFPSVISPNAYISKHSQIGKGTAIMHFAQVNAGAIIGNNCIINSKALIEHDSIVKDHCHISTGSNINGNVVVEEACFIGSNSTIIQGARVSSKSFIKAGSLFIRR
jgi:sugar O-acyltransferase (sialic acid O-acetyltransferase NeuD family)